jgi:CDP-alcohol phosphatidyltransferase
MVDIFYFWLPLLGCLTHRTFESRCGGISDGMVARKMNQTSSFGGLLDMVTDRCSTLGLLYVLGGEYAKVDEEIGFPFFRCVRVALTPVPV